MTGAMSIFVRHPGCFSLANMIKSYWQIRSFMASLVWVESHRAAFIYGL